MLKERIKEVQQKVAELTQRANQLYDCTLPPIQVRFDLRGQVAGWAGHVNGQYFMRFNTDMMQNSGWNHLLNDTVPHELAHIVCFFRNTDRGHGRYWYLTCRALGGSGERCHKEEVVYAKGHTFYYTTTTGHVIALSQQRHHKIQRGKSYIWRGRGEINKQCAYSLQNPLKTQQDAVTQVQTVTVAPAPAVTERVAATQSKAELCREKIKQIKTAGYNNEQGKAMVVEYCMSQLGMKRQLARVYTEGHWKKV